MSIKKTWFSYILWLLATGFSILFTYSYITGIVSCYSFEQISPVYCRVGITAAFILGVVLLYIFFGWIRSRIKGISIPKWVRRSFHILILCGLTALFVLTRYMVLQSTTLAKVVPMDIYKAAEVIFGSGQSVLQKSYYVMEEIYINVLSGLFLFLGNKVEIMLYFQIFLQAASFLLLLFVGRSLQNGFLGWIPASIYAVSYYCMDAVVCLDADNFWFFSILLVIAVICLLEKLWKNKTITYILIVLTGSLFSVLCIIDAFPHMADMDSVLEFWFHEKLIDGGADGYWSFLILMALMFFYCVSFWKTKTDNVSAYIIPVAGFSVVLYLNLWPDVLTAVFMLIRIYFSFMAAEGLRILFSAKPKVVTGQNAETFVENTIEAEEKAEEHVGTNDFTWTEMQSIMEQKEVGKVMMNANPDNDCCNAVIEDVVSEDNGVIRVSDILKAVNVESDNISDTVTESVSTEDVADKTAPIENVLPMPKKHVARSFEYAFEPTEELMHYDIEVENDDYDYE